MEEIKNRKIILVPVDFSETSRNAVRYAVEVAKHKNAKIVLMHAYMSGQNFLDMSGQLLAQNVLETKEQAETGLDKMAEEFVGNKLLFKKICKFGTLQDAIKEFTSQYRTWMIIMGTDSSGKLNELLGSSSTAEIAGKLNVPLLAIPFNYKYKGIRQIAFATDYHDSDLGSLKFIARLAELFSAHINVIHIADGDFTMGFEKEQMNNFKKDAAEKIEYKKISYQVILGNHVLHRLEKFLDAENPDMLAMATKHYSFIEKLLHKSITRKMIYHTHVPLMIFHFKDELVYHM